MGQVQRPVYVTRSVDSVYAKLCSLVDDVIIAYLDMLVFQTAMVMMNYILHDSQQKLFRMHK